VILLLNRWDMIMLETCLSNPEVAANRALLTASMSL
jgi:hypothetical protein